MARAQVEAERHALPEAGSGTGRRDCPEPLIPSGDSDGRAVWTWLKFEHIAVGLQNVRLSLFNIF